MSTTFPSPVLPSRTDAGPSPTSDPADLHQAVGWLTLERPPLRFPGAEELADLTAATHPLSVSVLLATSPGARMSQRDRTALTRLVRDVHRRLEDEEDAAGVAAVEEGLADAVAVAEEGPTDKGLAILVSPVRVDLHHLRVTPEDRVVIDPTFATRDLVRSVAEDPPFLLLALDGRSARLFHYDRRWLRPIHDGGFPMPRPELALRDRVPAEAVERMRRGQLQAFLRSVDKALAARVAELALPVVLVGSDRLIADFLGGGRGRRIAATIHSYDTDRPLVELEGMARAALRSHVTDRAAAAVDAALARLRQGRAVAGVTAAWQALLHVGPELLVVERTYAQSARLTGHELAAAQDREEPGVVDDVVDELIEAALARGAEVVCVPDGSLARHSRLLMTVTGPIPRW